VSLVRIRLFRGAAARMSHLCNVVVACICGNICNNNGNGICLNGICLESFFSMHTIVRNLRAAVEKIRMLCLCGSHTAPRVIYLHLI